MPDLDPYQAARKAKREREEYEDGFEERTAPYVYLDEERIADQMTADELRGITAPDY